MTTTRSQDAIEFDISSLSEAAGNLNRSAPHSSRRTDALDLIHDLINTYGRELAAAHLRDELDREDDSPAPVVRCRCGDSLEIHIGHKPCNFGADPRPARTIYDLPIASWAVAEQV